MVKRIVDTKFWTSMDVIDNYSVEDKFFALYLMTNGRTTQSGIYSLPKKVMSFETGFTTDVIQVLIDRFCKEYGRIIYSKETQEVTILKSLEYTILKGGAPVSDLLERELRTIKDGRLILATYQAMEIFWINSKRKFDQTVQSVFRNELIQRKLISKENDKQKQNDKENENDIYNDNKNENQNDNDNEESYGPNRSSKENPNRGQEKNPNREKTGSLLINSDGLLPEEQVYIEKYIEFIKYKNPSFTRSVTTKEILYVFYEEILGEVTSAVMESIKAWEEELPKSLILEAFVRSIDKYNPLAYVSSIIKNWLKNDVKNLRDVTRLDKEFSRMNNKER